MAIRLSGKHLVYSLASVFEMVSSPAVNVNEKAREDTRQNQPREQAGFRSSDSMTDHIHVVNQLKSLPVAAPFFISRSAASTFHDVISGTSFGSVWIMVLW